MYSIGKLCKEFHLSRSTLLYYDKIGLLSPKDRTGANYRQYSESDRAALRRICTLREAGVALDQIKETLDAQGANEEDILEKRLNDLNTEIRYLRLQQKMIVGMFRNKSLQGSNTLLDKDTFRKILLSAGINNKELGNLHQQFEKTAPEAHQLFLESLGLSDEEIKKLRGSLKL